jgi:DNA-binding protein HU-beta
MNSSELATIVAEAHDLPKAQAQAILDSVLKSILKAAASDDEVSLAGFGKFKVKASPEREGRNPANGEKIKIAALLFACQGSEGRLERLNTGPRLIVPF